MSIRVKIINWFTVKLEIKIQRFTVILGWADCSCLLIWSSNWTSWSSLIFPRIWPVLAIWMRLSSINRDFSGFTRQILFNRCLACKSSICINKFDLFSSNSCGSFEVGLAEDGLFDCCLAISSSRFLRIASSSGSIAHFHFHFHFPRKTWQRPGLDKKVVWIAFRIMHKLRHIGKRVVDQSQRRTFASGGDVSRGTFKFMPAQIIRKWCLWEEGTCAGRAILSP